MSELRFSPEREIVANELASQHRRLDVTPWKYNALILNKP
jgi:hypothetical protein